MSETGILVLNKISALKFEELLWQQNLPLRTEMTETRFLEMGAHKAELKKHTLVALGTQLRRSQSALKSEETALYMKLTKLYIVMMEISHQVMDELQTEL